MRIIRFRTILALVLMATATAAAAQDGTRLPASTVTGRSVSNAIITEGVLAFADPQLRELSEHARTPAEHQRVAEQYAALAHKQMKVADRYAVVAQSYRSEDIRTGGGGTAILYDQLAKHSRQLAAEARAQATKHRRLAQIG